MGMSSTNRLRFRLGIVALVICLLCPAVLVGRLAVVQLVDGEQYKQMAIDQQLRDTVIEPNRGTIFDKNMNPLALSTTVWNVIFEPANLSKDEELYEKQMDKIADELAPMLGADGEKVRQSAEKYPGSFYQVVQKKIDKATMEQVEAFLKETKEAKDGFSLPIVLEQDTKRFYPYENLASTVLGFVTTDNRGAYGLESYYNKVLSGTEGRLVSAKNALNGDMPFQYQKLYESEDGHSLVLTIDQTIQYFLEKHLEIAVSEHEVKERAVGIVMNVNTGEILAMSSKPDFDPNNPRVLTDPTAQERIDAAAEGRLEVFSDGSVQVSDEKVTENKAYQLQGDEEEIAQMTAQEKSDALRTQRLNDEQNRQWRNKAISDPYEPGSVFKLITASAALDTGSVTLNSSFFCPGYRIVADNKIHCWKRTNGGHGAETLTQAVMWSCNPAFIDIGQMTGVSNFSTYFDRFGLTDITGIDLPGEAESTYHSEKSMGIAELSSSSFGQTFKVTPLQLITAVSAALNGGNLMQPYIVKEVLDADKNVVETFSPQVKRQVISQETSETVGYLGYMVVHGEDGSGRNAYIPGYKTGGKTGTSQKLDKYHLTPDGYRDDYADRYQLSYLGFGPVEDPEVAVLVMLDEPTVGNAQSSTIAAPVVGAILEDILPYLGYEANYTEEEKEAQGEVTVGSYLNNKPHEAQNLIRTAGLKTEIIGSGPAVIKQIPEPGTKIPYGGSVILYTDETEANSMVEVPDVIGKTAIEANQILTNRSLNLEIVGQDEEGASTVVVTQDPPAGTEVEIGSIVTIHFEQAQEETTEEGEAGATAATVQSGSASSGSSSSSAGSSSSSSSSSSKKENQKKEEETSSLPLLTP